jgi:hypothetical protein
MVLMMMMMVIVAQGSLTDVQLQWKFEGNAADTSGNGLDANVFGYNNSFGTGYSGQAVYGASASWVKLTQGGNFNRTTEDTPIAIDFWFKPNANGQAGDLLHYGNAVSFIYGGAGNGNTVFLSFAGDLNGGGSVGIGSMSSPASIPDGWNHLEFVYANGKVNVWLNSAQFITDMDWSYGIKNTSLSSTTPFEMFMSQGIMGYFNGAIDEVAVSTPEPSTLAILGCVLSGMLMKRKK